MIENRSAENSTIVADLHTHTRASDGELSPEELVDLAAGAGLKALAVTDHDSLGGVERAIAQGTKRGIEVVPGCELTVYEGNSELHVLALFLKLDSCAELNALLQSMQEHRRKRGILMAQKLSAAGFALEEHDIREAAGNAESIGRMHVAAALAKRGHARGAKDALSRFLLRGGVGYVPKYPLTPEQAFAAVRAAGGVAILAHPGRTQHDELLSPLFHRGLDGVEAYYRTHPEMERRYYAGWARRCEKLVSGGSDYHGPRATPNVRLGASGVDKKTLSDLRSRAAQRQYVNALV